MASIVVLPQGEVETHCRAQPAEGKGCFGRADLALNLKVCGLRRFVPGGARRRSGMAHLQTREIVTKVLPGDPKLSVGVFAVPKVMILDCSCRLRANCMATNAPGGST